MTHLGTLEGSGFLAFGDKKISVEYEIVIHRGLGDGMNSAQGIATGKYLELAGAFAADSRVLLLQTGQKLPVILKDVSPDGSATLLVMGAIPGYGK
jgi:hypothetical protein